MLEAGTGVGKSFAYLVPALVWARENGERTVVSTNTINLQEQLVGKDLPILARALGTGDHSPTFALLKGWRNYICLSRLDQAREQGDSLFEDERRAELDGLAAWAARPSDGSLGVPARAPRRLQEPPESTPPAPGGWRRPRRPAAPREAGACQHARGAPARGGAPRRGRRVHATGATAGRRAGAGAGAAALGRVPHGRR